MSIYYKRTLSFLSIICLFFISDSAAKTTWIPINNGGVTFVIPSIPNGLFAAPTNVQKISQSGIVTLKWDDVQHASKYLIQGQNNDGTWVDVKVVSGNEAILDLAFKGYKAVRVKACNYNTCQGAGQPSQVVTTSAFCEASNKTYQQEGIVAAASGWSTQSNFNFQPPFCLECGNIPYNLKISNANSYLLFQWESSNVSGPTPVGPCEDDFVAPLPNSNDVFFKIAYTKDGISAPEMLKSYSTYKFLKATNGSTYQFKVQECRTTYNQSVVGEHCEGFSGLSPSLKVMSNALNLATPTAPFVYKNAEGLNIGGYVNHLADFYEIKIVDADAGSQVIKNTTENSFKYPEITLNKTYKVSVRACTYDVCSSWSAETVFNNKKGVIFIHTDLLGSPVAESME